MSYLRAMNPLEAVVAHLSRYIRLDESDVDRLKSSLTVKRVKKRQFIVQPGFVCRHKSYVVSGAFRTYLVDVDGKEHTLAFAVEDW